ncbi:unnamed protein product [Amoebophrya sp. A120]|nr:unnamed protein product [Amoebophrya sp. A120]|eukprot:GSA120T00023768001.1
MGIEMKNKLRLVLGAGFAAGAYGIKQACKCKYAGGTLPATTYNNFPTTNPGQHNSSAAISLYGTACAAWDSLPDTPYYDANATNFTGSENWVAQPWCFVDPSCDSAIASSAFSGSGEYYSYETCGTLNCWAAANSPMSAGCPVDITGTGSGKVDKAGSCACLGGAYYNSTTSTLETFPTMASRVNTTSNLMYGTTCAAWDFVAGTPYIGSCPTSGKDFCHSDNSWCQTPWCYVDSSCPSAVQSDFSTDVYYSYNTWELNTNSVGRIRGIE